MKKLTFRTDEITPELINTATKHIGHLVIKRSKKPFKSGELINTVANVVINPHTNYLAFTFRENPSYVDIWKCKLFDKQ